MIHHKISLCNTLFNFFVLWLFNKVQGKEFLCIHCNTYILVNFATVNHTCNEWTWRSMMHINTKLRRMHVEIVYSALDDTFPVVLCCDFLFRMVEHMFTVMNVWGVWNHHGNTVQHVSAVACQVTCVESLFLLSCVSIVEKLDIKSETALVPAVMLLFASRLVLFSYSTLLGFIT